MSNKILTAAWKEMLTTGNERLLLLALADQANDEGECWPSLKTLRIKVNAGDNRSIRRLCESLETKKYITRATRTRDNHSTTSNLFQINCENFVDSLEADTPRVAQPGGEGSRTRGGRVVQPGGGGFPNPPYEPSVESICEPPTNQPDVVDTQKQTINGKPMMDSYQSDPEPRPMCQECGSEDMAFDGIGWRCFTPHCPNLYEFPADKSSAGSGAVVGGLDSSMIGGEDPFYDGQVAEASDFFEGKEGDAFDIGWHDAQQGLAKRYDSALPEVAHHYADYLEGYAAGEKRAKARQAAPTREVKDVCVAPPADADVAAKPQDAPTGLSNRFISGVVATHVGAETTTLPAVAVEWSTQTIKYGDTLEASSNEVLWNGCLHYLKSEDMMYLQREKLKAKSNPLGYVRNAMIRLLMLEFETRTNPKANQPTKTDRPSDGPASHRLLVNDDPERERKLAEMEMLAGPGPVPEHMKLRRKKKEVQ